MKLDQIQTTSESKGGLKWGTPYRQPKIRYYPKWGTP